MVLVRYEKSDGRGGAYDILPDGRKAAIIEGNVVTVGLAPQVCTAVGRVMLMVTLRHQEKELSCFGICVHVQEGVDSKKIGSERYYHVRGFIPQPNDATVGEYIKVADVDEQGRILSVSTALEVAKDGKSAYQYALEAGYEGSEAEFSAKLATKNGGIHVGAEAPVDDACNVWIDTEEMSEDTTVNQAGVLGVTGAKVGQTIRVTAVDKDGGPIAWEAVDYQPRTHYAIPEKVLADNVALTTQYVRWINYDIIKDYSTVTVEVAGETYVCPVTKVTDFTQAGDESYFYIGNYNGAAPEYPFYVFGYIGHDYATIYPYSGFAVSVTANEVLQKIDNKFLDAEWMATTGKGRVPVLPKAEYICVDGIIDTFSYEDENAAIDRMEEFVSGKTYVVTLNGTEYECVAYNMVSSSGNVSPLVGIGNQAMCTMMPGVDNGLPFFIGQYPDRGYNEVYLQDDEGEYTVNLGIDIVGEVPIKLPEKFMPYERLAWVEKPDIDPYFDNDYGDREYLTIAAATDLVKISDYVLTEEECIGAEIRFMLNGQPKTCTASGALDISGEYGIPAFFVVASDFVYSDFPLVGVVKTGGTVEGVQVSAGTYYMSTGIGYASYFSALDGIEVVHKIDEKFLPEPVLTSPGGKKFKLNIDDNGAITATEV